MNEFSSKSRKFKGLTGELLTAEEYIKASCNGNDYGVGITEAAMFQAEKTATVLAALVQLLYDKGVITKPDIKSIARGY